MDKTALPTNSIAFIGLCNEYCATLEHARESERIEFVNAMLKLLPRIYISATDLPEAGLLGDDEQMYIEGALEEEYYDSVRRSVEALMGPDDMYLEVFEEDMKYSDTPIAASISEGLCDIFQVFYNFLDMVRDAPEESVAMTLVTVREDFGSYWSRILCNVLRALNHLRYSDRLDPDDDF